MKTTKKARRDYMAVSPCPTVQPEKVRVTGWAKVNEERWAKVRYAGDRVSTILIHPDYLVPCE